MHPRALIRAGIAEHLLGKTMAGERVFNSRLRDLSDREDLPAVLVYGRDETIDPASYPAGGDNGTLQRTLSIAIEAVVSTVDERSPEREDLIDQGAEDKLDALAWEIEAALEWAELPGFETATIRLMSSENQAITIGRRPLLGVRMIFEVAYRSPWRQEAPTCEPALELWSRPYAGEAERIA